MYLIEDIVCFGLRAGDYVLRLDKGVFLSRGQEQAYFSKKLNKKNVLTLGRLKFKNIETQKELGNKLSSDCILDAFRAC